MVNLVWYRRHDGLWNAECKCIATISGVVENMRSSAELHHFNITNIKRHGGCDYPPCGPKLPDVDNPYIPTPWIFR